MSAPVDVRYYVGDVEARTEFAACSVGELLGVPVFKEVSGDPVLGGRFRYVDGGWEWESHCPVRPRPAEENRLNVPECAPGCKWLQLFQHDRQRNALRMEVPSLVRSERCGWNILSGRLGGNPLDYAPCIRPALARARVQPAEIPTDLNVYTAAPVAPGVVS